MSRAHRLPGPFLRRLRGRHVVADAIGSSAGGPVDQRPLQPVVAARACHRWQRIGLGGELVAGALGRAFQGAALVSGQPAAPGKGPRALPTLGALVVVAQLAADYRRPADPGGWRHA